MSEIKFDSLELVDEEKPKYNKSEVLKYEDIERGGKARRSLNPKLISKDEPGRKVPTGSYRTVACFCDSCLDVQAHFHIPEKRKLKCSNCRMVSIY